MLDRQAHQAGADGHPYQRHCGCADDGDRRGQLGKVLADQALGDEAIGINGGDCREQNRHSHAEYHGRDANGGDDRERPEVCANQQGDRAESPCPERPQPARRM